MKERQRADRDVIDLMLAHAPENKIEAACNRAAHMVSKREFAPEWADLLPEAMPASATLLGSARR